MLFENREVGDRLEHRLKQRLMRERHPSTLSVAFGAKRTFSEPRLQNLDLRVRALRQNPLASSAAATAAARPAAGRAQGG